MRICVRQVNGEGGWVQEMWERITQGGLCEEKRREKRAKRHAAKGEQATIKGMARKREDCKGYRPTTTTAETTTQTLAKAGQ